MQLNHRRQMLFLVGGTISRLAERGMRTRMTTAVAGVQPRLRLPLWTTQLPRLSCQRQPNVAESETAVYGTVAANLATAVTEFTVASFGCSSPMLSDGVHSAIDASPKKRQLTGPDLVALAT